MMTIKLREFYWLKCSTKDTLQLQHKSTALFDYFTYNCITTKLKAFIMWRETQGDDGTIKHKYLLFGNIYKFVKYYDT